MASWPRQGHIVLGSTVEINLPWTTLTATSKGGNFIPASGWSLLGKFTKVRGWGELAGPTGKIEVTPAVQIASNPRRPGTVTNASTTFTKEGVFDAGRVVKIKMGNPKKGEAKSEAATYVRVGWVLASPSGRTVHAAASGMIELSTEKDFE